LWPPPSWKNPIIRACRWMDLVTAFEWGNLISRGSRSCPEWEKIPSVGHMDDGCTAKVRSIE